MILLYRLVGVDPAMFGGLLAIDMGGYQMAKELAADAHTRRMHLRFRSGQRVTGRYSAFFEKSVF